MSEELMSVQAVPMQTFDPGSLTGTFQPINGSNGFADDIKIFKLFNGSTTTGVELSLDGITAIDYLPPQGTAILDFQSNHSAITTYGNGTLYLRRGQIIWGRTTADQTFIFMSGYR